MRRRPVGGERTVRFDRARRFTVERLERRELLATFVVNSTGDADVMGTLRWAINQSNAAVGDDIINFAIPGAGVHTITPATALPTIEDQVTINGTSQGASATPLIVIDGTTAPAATNGLTLAVAGSRTPSSSIVRGLSIQNFSGAGISIGSGVDSVTVSGCFIGTDATGTVARPNAVGIAINDAESNTIGGLISTDRNVISGNLNAGLSFTGTDATANVVLGNFIGVDVTGGIALGNQGQGVLIGGTSTADTGANGNTVGGALVAARNVISGNGGAGVEITDSGASTNSVIGNYIGTNAAGAAAVANAIGVRIASGASRNSIGGSSASQRNVISGNTTADVVIQGANSNLLAGNFIGTNSAGNAAITGAGAASLGVLIQNGASQNTVGGTSPTLGNVISGHARAGLQILGRVAQADPVAANNLVQGNTIGAATGGTAAVPNATGILISDGTTGNTIGGASTTARNVISGNTGNGIEIRGSATTGNIVQGNYVGIDSGGTSPLANGQNGILIDGALNTSIGGTVAAAANTIAFNTGSGVAIPAGTGNSIRRNSIHSNGALGINLQGSSPGTGGNNLQAAPTLSSASSGSGSTVIAGTLTSTASTLFTIEFYSDTTPDASGAGEGRTFLGSTTVTTDASGNGTFLGTVIPAAADGIAISALAIASNGDTSQFATNIANDEVNADIAVTMTAAVDPAPATANTAPTSTFVTYTITVTNNGPDSAPSVTLVDTLPGNITFVGGTMTQGTLTQSGTTATIALGALAAGASATITLTIVSPAALPSTGTIVNSATATVGAGTNDGTTANNTASVTLNVVAGVNLSVTKVVTPNPPRLGEDFAFIITVTNKSAVLANNVVVTDTLPANVTFVSATSSQGTVSESGGVVTANLGALPVNQSGATLPAGTTATVTIVVRPTELGTIVSTVTATSTQPQTVAGNNTATTTLSVEAAVPVVISTSPTVTNVRRVGRGTQQTRLVVTYSESMDEQFAERLANYRLLLPGPDRRFGGGDDRPIGIRLAVYDDATQSVTLTPARSFSLHQLVRLRVIGTPAQGVRSATGVFLDGQNNGGTGTDYFVSFEGLGPEGEHDERGDSDLRVATRVPKTRREWPSMSSGSVMARVATHSRS